MANVWKSDLYRFGKSKLFYGIAALDVKGTRCQGDGVIDISRFKVVDNPVLLKLHLRHDLVTLSTGLLVVVALHFMNLLKNDQQPGMVLLVEYWQFLVHLCWQRIKVHYVSQ